MSQSTNKLLTEGVLLALFSVYGYSLGYVYELGYANYFSIPIDLISVSMPQSFIVVGKLLLIIFLMLMLMNLIFAFTKKNFASTRGYAIIMSFGPLFYLIIVRMYLFGTNWHEYWFFLLIALIFILPVYLDNRSERSDKYTDGVLDATKVTSWLMDSVSWQRLAFGMWAIVFISSSYDAGRARAASMTSYYVDHDDSSKVLLAVYGDNYVFESYSKKLMLFNGFITVQKISGPSMISLIKMNLGHIHSKDDKNNKVSEKVKTAANN